MVSTTTPREASIVSKPVFRQFQASATGFISTVAKAFSPFKGFEAVKASDNLAVASVIAFCELAPSSVELPTIATQEFNVTCFGPSAGPDGPVVVDCPDLFWGTDIPSGTMTPGHSNSSSTLSYYDADPMTGSVTASTLASPDGSISCSAEVNIVQDSATCALTPPSVELYGGDQQQFNITCFDVLGAATNCPVAIWKSDVPGTWVDPQADNESTTLYTGNVSGNGSLRATYSFGGVHYAKLVSCFAEVNVSYYYADSCELAPAQADVLVNDQQQFNVSCFDQFGSAINCPELNWETDVKDSFVVAVDDETAMFYAGSEDDHGLVKAGFSSGSGPFGTPRECVSYVHVYDPFKIDSCSVDPEHALVPFNGTQQFQATCYNADDQVVDCSELNWEFISPSLLDSRVDPIRDNSSTTFYAGETKGHGLISISWDGATGETDGPFYYWPPCSATVTVFDPDEPSSCEVTPLNALVPTWGQQEFDVTCFNGNGSVVSCPVMEWGTDVVGSIVDPEFSNDSTMFRAGPVEATGSVSASTFLGMEMGEFFECEAAVRVFDASAAESCNLTPPNADVEVNASQQFNAACFNLVGDQLNCPQLSWSTDVADSWMNPLQHNTSSTFYAGESAASGFVYADSLQASCNASVDVFEPVAAVSCNVTPPSASVPANSTQLFSVACFDASSQQVDCPLLDWSTDVPNSWVDPLQDNSSTIFYSGTTPSSGFVYADYYSAFSCQADVQVTTQVSSCGLNPLHAETTVNSTQLFAATCYDEFNNLVNCPVLDWTTTVTGGWMTPLQSIDSSTLYTGTTVEDDAAVTASTLSFNCSATVDVNPLNATSCILAPSSAELPIDSTQVFNVNCFDSLSGPVTCPAMNWSTDVSGSWVDPTQSNDYTTFHSGSIAANGSIYADHSLFSCLADVSVTSPQQEPAASCELAPASAQVPVNGSQAFTAQCFDSSNQSVDCPALVWTTNVLDAWMSPLLDNASSTFYAGTVTGNGFVNASTIDYSCTAIIQVVPLNATSCALNPDSVLMQVNSSQQFNVTCFDSANQTVGCPVLDWSTDLVDAFMQPGQSSVSSTLYAGLTDGSGLVLAEYVNGENFSCTAQVQVFNQSVASSCTLSPNPASVVVAGNAVFTASCLDQFDGPIACPLLSWQTNVSGSWVDPDQSDSDTTFYAGQVKANGSVIASTLQAIGGFECQAVVNVVAPDEPLWCGINPANAFVPLNGSQLFALTCYNSTNGTVNCPNMTWTTNATNSSMNPVQSNSSSTLNAGNVEEYAIVTAVDGFACNAEVQIFDDSASSCTLSPASARISFGAQQTFTATCFDSLGFAAACPLLDWSTTVTGASMNPTQSTGASTFTAGSTTSTGVVRATRSNEFYCGSSVETYYVPPAYYGGGDTSHDIYYGGGTSSGVGPTRGSATPSPTPTATPIPPRPITPSPSPTIEAAPVALTEQAVPSPTPAPAGVTGLFTAANAPWFVVVLSLIASALAAFRKRLGF
ncbi:hypothetical protein COU38_00060 [Candidatus Micrarchaeota archaeon CG10_big_fil_rev_8_21_14_0_10_54_18]|nr:MAG: hypothetical protein COU38_00060 [Candidatus Micrarchaeota archaeon CG10_big_fil_rev_8_21_14_0_10_54_18]